MRSAGRCFFSIWVCLAILFTATGAGAASSLALKGFYESAFQGEYGDTGRGRTIRWTRPIVICVKGEYTEADVATVGKLIFALASHVKNLPQMSLATGGKGANVTVTFAPEDEMGKVIKQYEEGCDGFVWVNYTNYRITSGKIVIDSGIGDREYRDAIIREEIVNMLGLVNDITCSSNSIICQEDSLVYDVTDLDYEMLNLLYDARIPPGTTLAKARKLLGE